MGLGSCGGLDLSPVQIRCSYASIYSPLVNFGTRAEKSSLIQPRHSVSAQYCIRPIVTAKHFFDFSIAIYFENEDLCFRIRLSCSIFFSLAS